MNVVRIPFAEQPEMPWANGLGRTRQVAIDPPDGSLARGFRWRISRAQVAADGPFSRLPGVDRSLWLVAGRGVRLHFPDRLVELTQPLQRCDFAGELDVHAELLDGPIADLNVMVARAAVRAEAAIVELAAGAPMRLPRALQCVVVVLRGAVSIAGVEAEEGDALRCEGTVDGEAIARADSRVLVASFSPLP